MNSKHPENERLVEAYNKVVDFLKTNWHEAEENTLPTLKENLEQARSKLSEWGEITREEIDNVSDYVQRDLHDAADYLGETGRDFKDWLKTDLEFAQSKFAEMFASMADKTRIELERFAEQARKVGEWHTGEVTGVGILECKSCGEHLHFDKPGHVPPCPKCHGTVYKKIFFQS